MKQKKIGTTLYVFSEDPYVITEDTDANIIYIQEEVIFDFAKINIPLISKMKPINYHIVCVKHPEWADYYNDFTVYVEQTTGGTVTAYPTSGDEGEEIQVSHLASESYDFDHWNIVDEDGNEIEVKNGKFLMPASNVTVSATFVLSYDQQYLTIESQADNNTISWKCYSDNYAPELEYKINDSDTWSSLVPTTDGTSSITCQNGDKIIFKSNLTNGGRFAKSRYVYFNSTGNFSVYGNIMSLIYGDDFIGKKTLEYTYQLQRLFSGCTNLIDASDLILPATTLSDDCYYGMFEACTSLINAPELPTTTLGTYCYEHMFYNCSSLTKAPVLPATTLVEGCYKEMFRGCTSLTNAPVLPATTLLQSCYSQMFQDCTSLNSITMLATDISANNCLYNWVSNVAATGTFTKATNMTDLTEGSSGIPTGWTVQNA